jgi:hypothetical protein
MPRFRLLVGSHQEKKGGEIFKAGDNDIIETDADLCKLFGHQKFQALDGKASKYRDHDPTFNKPDVMDLPNQPIKDEDVDVDELNLPDDAEQGGPTGPVTQKGKPRSGQPVRPSAPHASKIIMGTPPKDDTTSSRAKQEGGEEEDEDDRRAREQRETKEKAKQEEDEASKPVKSKAKKEETEESAPEDVTESFKGAKEAGLKVNKDGLNYSVLKGDKTLHEKPLKRSEVSGFIKKQASE